MATRARLIHPETILDGGYHARLTEALRHPEARQARMADSEFASILETNTRLLREEQDRTYSDRFCNGCKVTDAEVYSFSQLHTGLGRGMLDFIELPVPTHSTSLSAKLSALREIDVNGATLSVLDTASPRGIAVFPSAPLEFQRLVTIGVIEGMGDAVHPVWEVHEVQKLILDIGPTSACRTFWQLSTGNSVARWASNAARITLLYPTAAWIEKHGRIFKPSSGRASETTGVA